MEKTVREMRNPKEREEPRPLVFPEPDPEHTSPGVDAALREGLKQALEAGKFACEKCGRVFKTPSDFRYNARHEMICRRFCREAR
jgi:hypothetical protein